MAVLLRASANVTGLGGGDVYLQQNYLPGTVGGSNADATACTAHFRSVWNVLAAKMATGATITYSATCVAFEATTGILTGAFTGSTPATSAGAAGSAPLPLQTQGLIAWETAQVINGRRLRGRWFVPYPEEADNTGTNSSPSTSYVAQLQGAVTAMMVAPAASNLPVIWHRPTPGGSNGSHGVVTGGGGRGYWAVQRRRR